MRNLAAWEELISRASAQTCKRKEGDSCSNSSITSTACPSPKHLRLRRRAWAAPLPALALGLSPFFPSFSPFSSSLPSSPSLSSSLPFSLSIPYSFPFPPSSLFSFPPFLFPFPLLPFLHLDFPSLSFSLVLPSSLPSSFISFLVFLPPSSPLLSYFPPSFPSSPSLFPSPIHFYLVFLYTFLSFPAFLFFLLPSSSYQLSYFLSPSLSFPLILLLPIPPPTPPPPPPSNYPLLPAQHSSTSTRPPFSTPHSTHFLYHLLLFLPISCFACLLALCPLARARHVLGGGVTAGEAVCMDVWAGRRGEGIWVGG